MRYVKISKFLEEKEDVHWLVEGLLPDIGWTLFCGAEGIGKSTFAIQMCDAMQSGASFLDRKTKKTRILYVQADSKAIEWRAILERVSPKNDGFTVVDVEQGCLGDSSAVAALRNFVSVIKPGFVVWDSLYNLASEDINNPKVLRNIETINRICLSLPWMVIHHPPHGESRGAGTRALAANCSNSWYLLQTKLRIDKARLVAEKEVYIKRSGVEHGGTWALHRVKELKGTSYMDREI
jgi:RecA-family ATPase